MPQRPLQMVKRQFSLAVVEFEWLLGEAGFLGISVSELVRRAISEKRERTQATFNEIMRRAKKGVR